MKDEKGFFERIHEGDEIPALTKKPTYMQLFMFSAITWNRHLIHYNTEFARGDGLRDVATHRALLGNFLAQMLSDWVGEDGKVSKVEWSVRGGAAPGDVIMCRGKVVQKVEDEKGRRIGCDIWIENEDGTLIASGKGEVALSD